MTEISRPFWGVYATIPFHRCLEFNRTSTIWA